MALQQKRLIIIISIIAFLLLIPFIAMQFTTEVRWAPSDFLIMGTVLLAIGLSYEFIARRSNKTVYRAGFGVGLLGAFLLFWVNGAVGIIGNEGQTANYLYAAVLVVVLAGSLLARFKAPGMSRTLFAAAIVQMMVPVIAIVIWPPTAISWSPGVFGVFLLSAFFAMLFVVSGFLFRQAGSES